MTIDAPDWQPSTELTVGNAFVVVGGGNAAQGLETIGGVPLTGVLIAAPPANLAIAVYSIFGNINPSATTANRLELQAFVSYPSSWFDILNLRWVAGAVVFPVSCFLGGLVLQAGQPLGWKVSTAGLDDVDIMVTYRLVAP